jgi:CTD small phosphatase-like protein 2
LVFFTRNRKERFCQYYLNEVRNSFQTLEPSYYANLYRDHFFQSYQAYSIFKNATMPNYEEVQKRLVTLPDSKGMKTLIFDLDETLIHCTDAQKTEGEISLPIVFPNGESITAGINIRPYAKYVLEELSKYFQIVVFTASHACYANKVIDYLDPENKYVVKRLFRENCIFLPQGVFTKDLRIFGNRS